MILLFYSMKIFLVIQCFEYVDAKVDITRFQNVRLEIKDLRQKIDSQITLLNEQVSNVELPNQVCAPRKVLVNVEVAEMPRYSPMVVEVKRCGGVADGINPMLRNCVRDRKEMFRFPVRSSFDPNFVVYKEIENHLSCKGKCKHNASVCQGASKWDDKQCRCLCAMNQNCPQHFSWDPNKCACVCSRTCHRRQIVDHDDCSCTCKAKFFKRCAKRYATPSPYDCKCLRAPVAAASCKPCRCRRSALPDGFFYRYLLAKGKEKYK